MASGVHQFYGGMPAFDLVHHTGAVLDAGIGEMRTFFKGRPLFWANGQGGLWRKTGLTEVTEVPVVVDCEYASFSDYWATFTGGQGRFGTLYVTLSNDVRGALEQHVRDGYLVGLPDGTSVVSHDVSGGARYSPPLTPPRCSRWKCPPTTGVSPCDWRLPAPHPSHISSDCVLIGVLSDCLWIMR